MDVPKTPPVIITSTLLAFVGNAESVTGILPVDVAGTLAEDGTAGAVSLEVVTTNPGDQSLFTPSSNTY